MKQLLFISTTLPEKHPLINKALINTEREVRIGFPFLFAIESSRNENSEFLKIYVSLQLIYPKNEI